MVKTNQDIAGEQCTKYDHGLFALNNENKH